MKVIILCGGYGSRLKEETEYKPKPMVTIGGKPILWHIMKIYAHYGYNEFILALGYKANYIKQYFLDQKAYTTDFTIDTSTYKRKFHQNNNKQDNFRITFVDTGLDTLIGERILLCQKYIPNKDRYFMVTYGDGVADININKLLAFHKKQKTIGTITGVNPVSKYGMIKTDNHYQVTGFVEKPKLNDRINGGFMVFNYEYFEYLKFGEMEHPSFIRLLKKHQLSMYPLTGEWIAIDTYREYEQVNTIWKNNQAFWKIWD